MLFKRWISKKENTEKRLYDTLITAVEKLRDGDKSYIHIVYGGLGYGKSDLNSMIGDAIRVHLEGYSESQVIRLSELFRQYTSLEWLINWEKINLKDIKSDFQQETDYFYALVVGSFHPNGYFREKCILELSNYPKSLSYIVLRLNDWVEPVRRCAEELVYLKVQNCSLDEIFRAILSFHKVQRSLRRDGRELQNIYECLLKRIENEIVSFPMEQIFQYDYEIRKNIYKILFSKKIIELKKVDLLLTKEKQSYCKALIISGLFNYYQCTIQQVDDYLKNENGFVERKALEYKYSLLNGVWDGLEDMLLDRVYCIREYVTWILRKHSNLNILDFYKNRLVGNSMQIAIMGIGENGDKDQVSLLLPYLSHEDNKIVKVTLLTLGKLMGCDGYDMYWQYLMDERLEVSKSAYLSIQKNQILYGAKKLYDEYQVNKLYHVRRYLVLLIMQENSWERLPYLLGFYGNAQLAELQDKIQMKIRCRNMYGKISLEQAKLIENEMDEKKDVIPKNILEDIRFELKYVL